MSTVPRFKIKKSPSFTRRTNRTHLVFRAIKQGALTTAKQLVKEGDIRINFRLEDRTLLHVAVRSRFSTVAVVRLLVQAGCRINSVNIRGDTALHIALQYHKLGIARYLIKAGADVQAKNFECETPLQMAVSNKSHVDLLTEMLPNGALYEKCRFYGLISLELATVAVRYRRWIRRLVESYGGKSVYGSEFRKVVKMLLDAGADVNARDISDSTPLHCAVYTGDVEVVKILIKAGADLNHRTEAGFAVLHDAVLCGNEEMVRLLLRSGSRIDQDVEDIGDTALHWAIRLNIEGSHEKIIKLLMKFGSNMYKLNTFAESPFNYVLQYGDLKLLNFFINEYKADIKMANVPDGKHPLMFAAQNKHQEVLDWVLDSGVNVNTLCEKFNASALHLAASVCLPKNVRRLISKGANVNIKNDLQRTPIFNTIFSIHGPEDNMIPALLFRQNFEEERKEVMRLLLHSGADINYLIKMELLNIDRTILQFAYDFKDITACEVIIQYAAMVEVKTRVPMFSEYNRRLIENSIQMKTYYQWCLDEATHMGATKIAEDSCVTFLSVLIDNLDKVARYTKNDAIFDNWFDAVQQGVYRIYGDYLDERLVTAVDRQYRFEDIYGTLCTMQRFKDLDDVPLEIISKYLMDEDVKFIPT
ncbi:hypothetical protein TSAR_009568 [Trichomalopsis sarcophagae]|uniref:Uncharacterized protein n=1 Tax=Trichomalopsis sarcophagae TaxID=543379 RepID=A0A232FEL2_9HYME|nr:hypothetical protein TSAR_009568 [Trichomalopsis sarcophagae]